MPTIEGWVPRLNQNGQLAGGQFVCPHCDCHATFTVASLAHLATPAAVITCDSSPCGKLTYVVGANRLFVSLEDYFPKATVPTPHESIPNQIAKDWFEAQQDFENCALVSAALMCRRVLYGVLLDQGCKEHPLHEGIAELAGKAGLPRLLLDKLHEIKEDGHDAAHPSRALQLDPENVAESVRYTEDLLRSVYEEPWRLRQRYARKGAAGAAGGQ